MGRRDYRHREPKKVKKNAKKISPLNIVSTPANVEVIKKVRKKREEEEE
jgi:hypothetical protein